MFQAQHGGLKSSLSPLKLCPLPLSLTVLYSYNCQYTDFCSTLTCDLDFIFLIIKTPCKEFANEKHTVRLVRPKVCVSQ